MEKKLSLASLAAAALFGSLLVFFASNLFFADIGNIAVGPSGMLVSFPAMMLASLFVAATLYFIRLYKRPKNAKSLTKFYVIMLLALSGVGLVTTLLSGFIYYGSLIKPYPFAGYHIVCLILFILLIGGGVYALLRVKKMRDDEEKFKMSAKHVFSTLGWTLFIFLAYNRFGNFLMSPTFIQWRTFYMSFPFYIFLLTPMCLGVIKVLDIFGIFDGRKKLELILASATIGVALVLFIVTVVIGLNDTGLISAVSQCMPLERLASKPLEIMIHIVSYLAVSGIIIFQSAKALKVK